MTPRLFHFALCAGLLGAALPANAARLYVSARTGDDASTCTTIGAPCRTFQRAHDAAGAGDAILIVDPGDYGPLVITKSISIVNDGVGVAGILSTPSGANALVINGATTDRVYLSGLTFDSPARGLNGVLVNTAGVVHFTKLNVRNYLHGVNICPRVALSFFTLTNTVTSNNVNGVAVMAEEPPGAVVGEIRNVVSVNNRDYGIRIEGDNGSAPMRLAIADTVFSNNGLAGVIAVSSTTSTSVTLRNVAMSNSGVGLHAEGSSVFMRLAHSVATGNGYGVRLLSNAKLESAGDNNLLGNQTQNVDAAGGDMQTLAPQ